ncbi:MAG: hypothetical protein H0W64_03850 [Gammaproteobacteria bacterium]|nr:hypothetical protein [Gammaproteobacteria bacterium]
MTNQNSQPVQNEKKNSSSTKSLLSAIIAAESDQALHPLDTMTKRIENAHSPIRNYKQFKNVIFPASLTKQSSEMVSKPTFFKGLQSLSKGFGLAALNKGLTRTYRFYIQDQLQATIQEKGDPILKKKLNHKKRQSLYGSAAGIVEGVTESIIFNPLDRLKTLVQASPTPQSLPHGGWYNGVGASALRNAYCAGTVFGIYNYFLGHAKDKHHPTPKETAAAATGAALINTTLSHPLDVIKTRLQVELTQGEKVGMVAMAEKMLKEEGPTAFTRGIVPKIIQAPIKSGLPLATYGILTQAQRLKSALVKEKEITSPSLRK